MTRMLIDGPFAGLERNGFGAIVADPPWSFKTRAPPKPEHSRRDAARHYPVMELPALMELPVRTLAARASHLFLWTSGPFVPQALQLLDAWGFRYSTVAMTWLKLKGSAGDGPWTEADLHLGLGLTFRKNTEIVLLGRRGPARRLAKDVREVIIAPVREHSRKPHEAYARVERYCDGPFLELFARQHRLGWTAWGNEVGKLPLPRQTIRRRSAPPVLTHNPSQALPRSSR